jgi:hypothetical protein
VPCINCGPTETPRDACFRACAANGDSPSSCASTCSG